MSEHQENPSIQAAKSDELMVIANTLSNAALWPVVRHLKLADFTDRRYRRLWRAMTRCSIDENGMNPMSICAIDPDLDLSWVQSLIDHANDSLAATQTACERIVRAGRGEAALDVLRQGSRQIENALNQRHDQKISWQEALATMMNSIVRLAGDDRTVGNHQLENELFNHLTDPPERIRTGIKHLDDWLQGGLMPEKILGIAADAKVGKTVLALTISENLESGSVPVPHLLISNERTRLEMARIRMARKLGQPASSLHRLTQEQMNIIKGHRKPYETTQTLHAPGISLETIRSEATFHKDTSGIRLVIIDYLQLIGGNHTKATREQHMNHVCQGLQMIASDLQLPIIVMVGMNSDNSFKDYAQAITQSAHGVLQLRRDIASPTAYFECIASNLGSELNIGSPTDPTVYLDSAGPHFRDPTEAEIASVAQSFRQISRASATGYR